MSILQSLASDSAAPVFASDGAPVTAQAAISLDTLAVNTSARVVDLVSASNVEEQEADAAPGNRFSAWRRVRIVATGFPGPDPLAVRVGAATFALRRYGKRRGSWWRWRQRHECAH